MAWSTIPPWVSGNALTAAELNTYVRDNLNALTTWESYTPALTNWTVGNGTIEGWFVWAGDVVDFNILFTLGSTTTTSGLFICSLPIVAAANRMPVGEAVLWDTSTSANRTQGVAATTAGDASNLFVYYSGGSVDTDEPFTWADGDHLNITGRYRAA